LIKHLFYKINFKKTRRWYVSYFCDHYLKNE